ncbi:MAG: tRNA(5-methylaminomethyl-2-thiouridylate) methyltransferase [Mailhella sp.]|nr:tRNA(5-methylaminomethyl-2-thiouridylate) methyltransferase [Mailhella sp.]
MKHYDGLALFSGGLDSLLTALLLMEQGLAIKCLHFYSPFFGSPRRVQHWREVYGLDIDAVDVGDAYVDMLRQGPAHGFGSAMNPCVDCKILMMKRTRGLLAEYGASFIASGEVLGQRPMSQRRDTLNIILRDAGVRGLLLRPLCAQHLEPTQAELSGLVDRSRLLGFNGRGRKDQLALAQKYGVQEIPTPGGGCKLTEKENTRRFWPVLRHVSSPVADDFRLADIGRQFWLGQCWLSIGRHQQDNEAYAGILRNEDLLFKVSGFPGPLAVGRGGRTWDAEAVRMAASLMASYSPKACRAAEEGRSIAVNITSNGQSSQLEVAPLRESLFKEPSWESARDELYALRKPGHVSGD